jgi:single-stranded-DNA-specific exonuclease
LCKRIGIPLSQTEADEMLALAAIATLCDIVELVDENRILVTCGLEVLNKNKLINPGIGSLITMRGYLDKPMDATAVGFAIGPCMNAAGRLKSAALAVELLLTETEDSQKRISLAQELTELNETRKALTAECVERLRPQVEASADRVLVLTDFYAHESIAGIVAGRIRDMTARPTILLTRGDNAAKGSGRSIPAYNLFDALYKHRDMLIRFGGHALAAGLTLEESAIDQLRTSLNNDCALSDEDATPTTYVDFELAPEEITLVLSEELARLAPFGKGNKEPLFVSRNLFAEKVKVLNEKNTLIFSFVTKNNRHLKGVAFGLNEEFAAIANGETTGIVLDAVYSIETNVWNGVSSVQIRIKEFRMAD